MSVVVVTASACGEVKAHSNSDGGGDDASSADFTLTVNPGSLTIPIAGSAQVTVTVERMGTTGDISLSATGLGGNLTAEFSPPTIPEGSTTSAVTISVKGGTAAGTSTVTLTGTAGEATHSADIEVTTTTITVTGTVRGGRAGVTVGIIGKGSLTSGAGGVFTFTDVTPPYDLYTLADFTCANNTTPTAYYFDDLTRPDPTVTAASQCPSFGLCGFPSPCPSSDVSGTKTGTGNNTDPVVWAWSEGSFNNGVLNPNGTFSGSASWVSGTTSSGYLHAIQLTRKANGAPNTFLGYARRQLMLTSGQAATGVSANFTTVNTSATVNGTLNAAPDYPAPSVSLIQQFGNSEKSLWDATTTTIDAAFPIISTAGGTCLFASSTLDGATSYFAQPLTGTTTIDFTMPAAAVPLMPEGNATGVTTATTFAWTAPTGVISEAFFSTSGTTRVAYRVFTTNDQISIPVIPELPLPSGQTFQWKVYGYGPYTHINEAAGLNELQVVLGSSFVGPLRAYTAAVTRSFTTQ